MKESSGQTTGQTTDKKVNEMKMLNNRTLAVALIAALLTLAAVENHAQEAGLNLNEMNDAMRLQVMGELENNVQRLYENDWMTGLARDDALRLQVMAELQNNVQWQWLYENAWMRGAFSKGAVARAVSAGLPPRAGAARLLSAH